MTIFLLFLLLILPHSSAKAADESAFISKEGKFSINFPAAIEESKSSFENGAAKGEIHNFICKKDGQIYGISYVEYQKIDAQFTAKERNFVNNAASKFVSSIKGTVYAAVNISYNDYVGRALKAKAEDKYLYSRIFFVKNRIYQIATIVETAKEKEHATTIDKFINSFYLLDDAGKPIINNSSFPEHSSLTPLFQHKIEPANVNSTDKDPILTPAPPQGIQSPKITEKSKPEYTKDARANGVEGIVVLSAVFRKDGTISDIKVVNSLGYGLDEEAIKAAAKVKFTPGTKDGEKVNIRARLEFTFALLYD